MYKILVWGIGERYNKMRNLIRYFEMTNQMCIVALVDKNGFMDALDGYRVVTPDHIEYLEWDYIVIMADKSFEAIVKDVVNVYKIEREKIIPYKVLQIPEIDMDSYFELKKANISIVSNNCWGGMVYKTLGIKCISPFRNLFLYDRDYIKLIKNFKHYMEMMPQFRYDAVDIHSGKKYPVLQIDDIELHCNHESDYNKAIEDWERRKIRINYDNLYFEMYTCDHDIANQFVEVIATKKGVCFVDWNTDEEKMISLDKVYGLELWELVNANAALSNFGVKYSLVDLLLGKKKYRY